MKFNVYGFSDWPEYEGQTRFDIYLNKEFDNAAQAIEAARKAYYPDIELEVEEVTSIGI